MLVAVVIAIIVSVALEASAAGQVGSAAANIAADHYRADDEPPLSSVQVQ
jgi:hypothetical protein